MPAVNQGASGVGAGTAPNYANVPSVKPSAAPQPFNYPNYIGGYGGYTPHPPGYSDGVPNAGAPPPQQFNPSAYLTDPGYLAALNAQQQGDAQLQAQLRNQIQQAIIQYGDPSLASQADFGLDNQSAAFAKQNYLSGNSTKARIDKANQDALRGIVNTLAGHGLLFSGDYGYDNQQQATTYGNQIYDAQQAVLNAIAGYRSTALSQEQGLQQSVVAALEQAYTNMVNQQIANGGYTGSTPGGAATAPQANPTTPRTTAAGVAAALKPYAVKIKANPTGGSANATQGLFSTH